MTLTQEVNYVFYKGASLRINAFVAKPVGNGTVDSNYLETSLHEDIDKEITQFVIYQSYPKLL